MHTNRIIPQHLWDTLKCQLWAITSVADHTDANCGWKGANLRQAQKRLSHWRRWHSRKTSYGHMISGRWWSGSRFPSSIPKCSVRYKTYLVSIWEVLFLHHLIWVQTLIGPTTTLLLVSTYDSVLKDNMTVWVQLMNLKYLTIVKEPLFEETATLTFWAEPLWRLINQHYGFFSSIYVRILKHFFLL